jgi:DNA-binding PadR family transcriptional regulator
VIDLAVLGLLKESDFHGYELKKRLRELLGPLSRVSFGSLYPALNRLEREGLVKAVEAHVAPTFPATGSFAGEAAAFRTARRLASRGPRNKKVYGITPSGEERLVELLASPDDGDDRAFKLKLAFARWCEPDVRIELLRRRRATLVTRLGESRNAIGARGERLDHYVRSLLEHDTDSTERDIAWIDGLIEEETSA